VRENLEVVRRLRRLRRPGCVNDAIDRLGLTPYADRRARTLSLGNLQRLGLAKALIHAPDLVILDEPANGLDPAGVVEIRDLLRDLAANGATVFLSSHVLAEVARLASLVGILHAGRLVEERTAGDLEARVRRWLSVATRDDEAARRAMREAGLTVADAPHGLVCADAHAVDAPDEVATLLVSAGCPPVRLLVEREDLEEYFLRTVAGPDA
jgi:ABC-2 type transport system ATP-binding protein